MYHGYGTKIIQSVVQKYHGYINYDTNGEVFETQAMLALNEAR
jgi:sensor histidine kinase regulating citrate/malate metabolism